MKLNLLKFLFLTLISLLGVAAQAQTYTYQLTYSNGGTGSITFNSLTLSSTVAPPVIPSYVSAVSLSLGGSTYSLTSGTPITGIYLTPASGSSITLNPANPANIKSSLMDLNFFTRPTAGCGVGATTPNGTGPFVITNCSNSTTYTLQSIIFGSGGDISGPSTYNTQASIQNTANALQRIYSLQNAVLTNSFTYDCTEYGENNVCVSAGGRNTAVGSAGGLNNTSGLVILGYRPAPNYRVGAYADQNLWVNQANSGVSLGNNTPLMGLFGVWSENLDGTGTEVKVSAAYGQKNTTMTRGVVGTGTTASEAGVGSSQLNSQGAQVAVKYGFNVMQDVNVAPYAGIRYTKNNMGGYSEQATSAVTAPLTYGALYTNSTTALLGLGASYKGIAQTTVFASAGYESDTNTALGTYSGNSAAISGLAPVNFNQNPIKNRPTASLGAAYQIEKNQSIGITGIYRQEAYQSISTTTVLATYTAGF